MTTGTSFSGFLTVRPLQNHLEFLEQKAYSITVTNSSLPDKILSTKQNSAPKKSAFLLILKGLKVLVNQDGPTMAMGPEIGRLKDKGNI